MNLGQCDALSKENSVISCHAFTTKGFTLKQPLSFLGLRVLRTIGFREPFINKQTKLVFFFFFSTKSFMKNINDFIIYLLFLIVLTLL